MTNPSSVCIIGGGHNGLICAIMLAKAGLRVTVLEARASLGGAIAPRAFAPGFQAPGLAHHFGSLHPKILKDLGLPPTGGTPVDTIALDNTGDHLTLGATQASGNGLTSQDKEAYTAFKTDYAKFAQALEPLLLNKPPRLKDMGRDDQWTLAKLGWSLRFGLGVPSMREFLRVGGANIYDVLNEIFESEQLKGAIAVDAVMGHHLAPRTPTSVLPFLLRLFGESHSERSIMTGEGSNLSAQLEKLALSSGIELRTETKVETIVVTDGRAAGVVIEGGERVDADLVVSNIDAKSTFLRLTGPANLDAMFTHRISKTRTNGNVAKLHLGLSTLPTFQGLSSDQLRHRMLIAPDMRFIERAFNHAKYGEYSEDPVLEITLPSLGDPSLAPQGKHVMSISASFAPYHLKEGWEQGRTIFRKIIISAIEKFAPGLEASVEAEDFLSPADIEQDYGISGGHWHHGEMTIDQAFMMRPIHGTAQYNTPIDNLYLCGASAHPGGGVTGIPGWNAAKRILSLHQERG